MINLLPNQAKDAYLRIYHLRTAVVIGVLVFFLTVMAVLLLVPSYMLIIAKEQIAESKLTAITGTRTKSHDSLDTIVKDINTKLSIFPNNPDHFLLSADGIDAIVSKRLPGIFITGFRYERKSGGVHQISISGNSTSREVLQNFVKSLAIDGRYQGVTLPLSNFIYGSNIPFNLAFTAKIQ